MVVMVPGVLGGGFDVQTSLSIAWTKVKNQVYSKQLVISLPLPDPSGHVDLSIDTTKLDNTQVGLSVVIFVVQVVVVVVEVVVVVVGKCSCGC